MQTHPTKQDPRALVTPLRCLSLPICTTHFTGYLTDVGTGLGVWARALVSGENPPTLLKAGEERVEEGGFMSCGSVLSLLGHIR